MKLTEKLIQNKDITQDDVCPISVKFKEITYDSIENAVSQITGIHREVMHMKTRKREILEARQFVISFARKYKLGTLTYIGTYFNKSHATVINACSKIEDLRQTDKDISKMYNEIEKLL